MPMDPHPTPFPAKRRPAAVPAKAAVPKPKSIATARAKMAKQSPTSNGAAAGVGAAPQPRPRRAFGTTRSSNALAEKPPPPPPLPQKSSKVSPPPPPPQKPLKVSAPPPQRAAKVSPSNPVKATKPARLAANPLKKVCPGPDLELKAKKRSQRVNFQEDVAVALAPGSGEKAKAPGEDAAGHTPMVSAKVLEKKEAKVVAAETPFFSAQNCSSCTLDQLESASYWLAHIRLAEAVGKHKVAAAFFSLAFECQAQPVHRIQSELRNYAVRHESASTLTPLFGELLFAHGMAVNQPKFDADGFDKVATPLTTNVVDKQINVTTLKLDECLECDCGGGLVDVGGVNTVKQHSEGMTQPSFETKLDESFEFDDSEAVIVDRQVDARSELEKNAIKKVSCDTEISHSAGRSSIDKLCLKGSPVRGSSERRLSSDSPFSKLFPSGQSLSAKRLSSGSPCDKKSPFGSSSSMRLTSSCPYKKLSTKGLSSKHMSSGSHSGAEHNASTGVVGSSKLIQDGEFDSHAVDDQLGLNDQGVDAAIDEII